MAVEASEKASSGPNADDASAVPVCTGAIKPVAPDGNCMFSAALAELHRVGASASKPVEHVQALRDTLLAWVVKNGDAICAGLTIEQWVEFETGESLAGYVRRMSRPSEW